MRTFIALALAATIAVPAFAQRPQRPGGGGFGGPPTGVALLSSEDVQKDLKLTTEQKEKVKTYLAKQAEERRAAGGGGGARPDAEKLAELRKKAQEANTAFQKDALTDEQTKRLKQIGLQVGGLAVFSSEEVAKDLKISDEQKEKIKAITDQLRKDRTEVRGGAGGGGRPQPLTADQQKKIDALQKEATEKVQEVLTSDQKKTWETMIGAKFEGKIAPPGGGRQGGRGNRPAAPPAEKKPDAAK
jgi:hypothetical protein